MRHRLVIAAALLLALAGCSDDSPTPKASASTTPATASPSPTGPVAPVLPSAAKANTPVGAKAFVRYWFEAATYAMKTGETGPMDAVAGQTCKACVAISKSIHAIYSKDQRNVGGGWEIKTIDHDPRIKLPDYRFVVRVVQPPQTLVDADGKVLDRDPRKVFVFFAGATWRGEWQIYGLQELG
jgi:hypothetical protein